MPLESFIHLASVHLVPATHPILYREHLGCVQLKQQNKPRVKENIARLSSVD